MLELQHLGRLVHARFDFRFRHLAQPQTECHVFKHRLVRIQRVVLEHHGNLALARRQTIHTPAVDCDFASRDVLEARQHAHQRRLAATGRSNEHDELAVLYIQVDVVQDGHAVVVGLDHLVKDDCRHRSLLARIA